MKSKKLRILFVTPFFSPVIGGVESVLETTCQSLSEHGQSVQILTSSIQGHPYQEKKHGYKIVRSDLLRVPDRGLLQAERFDYGSIQRMFRQILSEFDPSIIHLHNYQMRAYSMFLAPFLNAVDTTRCATINTMHNDSDDSFSHYVLAYSPLDRVITVTTRAAVDLFEAGVPSKKIVTVPNMLDVELFRKASGASIRKALGVSKNDPIVLFPSRIIGREGNFLFDSKTGKGLSSLIKAWPEIIEAIPNAKLMLLGNDPIFKAEIHDFKKRLKGIVDKIRQDSLLFLDQPIPNSYLPELFAASDLVVSLSPREAFGMIFLEAMASGRPVVGVNSEIGGVPEVVPDEIAGYLVPQNDPHAVAKAITKILSDEDIRNYFQRGGLNWVRKKYDVNVVAPELIGTYRTILSEKHISVLDEETDAAIPISGEIKRPFLDSGNSDLQ